MKLLVSLLVLVTLISALHAQSVSLATARVKFLGNPNQNTRIHHRQWSSASSLTERAISPSSALVAFAYMFNGIFYEGQLTSCEQIRNPDIATGPSVIIRPFDVPALYPEWTLYLVVAFNSTIFDEKFLILRMESDGSVRMIPVLFVNKPVRTQGQFDTDFIKTLSLSDLIRTDCESKYFFQPPNVFTGTYPQCGSKNDPLLNTTITCESLDELEPGLTLTRVLSCPRYPLLPYMLSEFPDPCPGQRMCRK